jgi:hypothetical protein
MITDCHTHVWDHVARPAGVTLGTAPPAGARGFHDYRHSAGPVAASFVLGFAGHGMGAPVPNEELADFVAHEPGRLFGFAGIDPSDPFALTEIDRAVELGLRGITLSPAAQGIHPADNRAMDVYQRAVELNLPVIFRQGGHFAPEWRMEFARPYLLDEVARTFPDLRLVVSHLGQPWVDETVVLLDKHEHVYADVCGLSGRPWQAYQALSLCWNAGVMHKLLFASDFPYATVEQAIKALYSVNELTQGTNLPTVPLRELRGVVERDTLFLLGLSSRSVEPAAVAVHIGDAADAEPDSSEEEAVKM